MALTASYLQDQDPDTPGNIANGSDRALVSVGVAYDCVTLW